MRLRTFGLLAIFGMAAAMVTAPVAAQEEKIPIVKEIWAFYKEYEANVGGARSGFFAVAIDGSYATSIYCPDVRCRNSGRLRSKVVANCEDKGGVDCVVFAHNRDILVDYELLDE